MTASFPSAVWRRWRSGVRFVFRMGHRTVVESLYLLTAPVTAAAGLLLVLTGLCIGAVGLLLPGRSPVVAGGLALVRWFADVERWRIAKVRSPAVGVEGVGQRRRPKETATASGPGLWLGVAHAVAVLPVALVTSVVTVLWWFVGLGAGTCAAPTRPPGRCGPRP
ncbi:sensor domain-containing protein [Micromonospora sp. NPDC048063]|uniref:sensor domain-containing protein n=1 Tax=Micromonospora sp. NPDC048063 TaxID=3364256 RepID=UPI0037120EBF